MKTLSLLLFPIALLLPLSSAAQTDDKAPKGNKIHFAITENQQVENDTISVSFKKISQGRTAQAVMDDINKKMKTAVSLLKKYPDIVIQTSQYNIHPVYNKQRVISHWKGHQLLTLTFDKKPELLKSLTELQSHLSYHSMRFSVSDALKQQLLNTLTVRAITRFQKQADMIADSFQASHYKILETRINMPNQPRPIQNFGGARMMMAESMAPPAVEAGESTIKVHISGVMLIPD